jgi:hypothetical protein
MGSVTLRPKLYSTKFLNVKVCDMHHSAKTGPQTLQMYLARHQNVCQTDDLSYGFLTVGRREKPLMPIHGQLSSQYCRKTFLSL